MNKNEIYGLKEENRHVTYSGEEMLQALQEIEYMLISLNRIGSYYADKDPKEYEKETTAFIDSSLVCDRLAAIRTYLSSAFDCCEGDDDMDDVERACEAVEVWHKPSDFTEEKWLKIRYEDD